MADVKEAAEKVTTGAKKSAGKAKAAADANFQVFAEAGQTAFKEGFERSTAALGEISEYGKGNLDAVIASLTAATQGAEAINSNVVAFTKKSMEDSIEAAKSLATAKSVQEAIELQTDYAKSALDSYLSEVTKAADLFAATLKDAWKPLNDRAAAAMDQVQAAR